MPVFFTDWVCVCAHYRRMIGKELDGMSYAELYVLGFDITRALMNVMQEMDKIKHAARVSKVEKYIFYYNYLSTTYNETRIETFQN